MAAVDGAQLDEGQRPDPVADPTEVVDVDDPSRRHHRREHPDEAPPADERHHSHAGQQHHQQADVEAVGLDVVRRQPHAVGKPEAAGEQEGLVVRLAGGAEQVGEGVQPGVGGRVVGLGPLAAEGVGGAALQVLHEGEQLQGGQPHGQAARHHELAGLGQPLPTLTQLPGEEQPQRDVGQHQSPAEEERLRVPGQERPQDGQRVAAPGQPLPHPAPGLHGHLGEVQAGGQADGGPGMGPRQPQDVVGGEHEPRPAHQAGDVREGDLAQEQVREQPHDEQLEGGRGHQRGPQGQGVEGHAEGRQDGGHVVGQVRGAGPVVGVPHREVAVEQVLLVELQPRLHLEHRVGEQDVSEDVVVGDGADEGRRLGQVGGRVRPPGRQRLPEEHRQEDEEHDGGTEDLTGGGSPLRRVPGRSGDVGHGAACYG